MQILKHSSVVVLNSAALCFCTVQLCASVRCSADDLYGAALSFCTVQRCASVLGLNPWWMLSILWGVKTCFYVGCDSETGFVHNLIGQKPVKPL